VGDGVVDDTESIRAAIDASQVVTPPPGPSTQTHKPSFQPETTYSTVFFPAGTYIVSDTLQVKKGKKRREAL